MMDDLKFLEESIPAGDIDQVAVYRATRGEPIKLNMAERRLAIKELLRTYDMATTGRKLGMSETTVRRHKRGFENE